MKKDKIQNLYLWCLLNNPELLKEWNYDKNENGPECYAPKSNKKVWWKCRKNHEWLATSCNRIRGDRLSILFR